MARAAGGDVRVVYSPLDALEVARRNPEKTVVFFAVGFETTAPANAMAVKQAQALGVENFALLVAHVLVPPAITAILRLAGQPRAGVPRARVTSARSRGGASTSRSRGTSACRSSSPGSSRSTCSRASACWCGSSRRAAPRSRTSTCARSSRDGNAAARAVVDEVFEVADRAWRGIGVIPESGLQAARAVRDARRRARSSRTRAAPGERVRDLHRGRRPARPREAARLPGVRHALHARSTRSARRWSRPRARAPPTSWPAGPARRRRRERRRSEREPGVRAAVPGAAPAGRIGAARPRLRRQAHAAADPRAVRARSAATPSSRAWATPPCWRSRRRAARVHDRRVRRPAGVLPGLEHRRARGERHGERPRDDGRRAARARPRR